MSAPLHDYAHGHDESVLRSHTSRSVANSAQYLLPHLTALSSRDGSRILDVGCGPGTLTADLAAHAPGSTVTAIDASADVIAQAARDHGDVASFATGDVYALEHIDDHFDIVHAHQVLQHLDRPVDALREMRRVTRPGGVVGVRDADYAGMTWAPESPGMTEWMRIYQAMTAANGHDANAGRHLLGWAQSAGFRRIDVTASVWCFAEADSRSWWADIWADRVRRSNYRTHALEHGLADDDDLQAIADDFRTWAKADDGIFVVPHVELVCVA